MAIIRQLMKRTAMVLAFVVVALWARITKKKLSRVKKVGILFLPILGIGDLVMLSPAIQKIAEIFFDTEVALITWVPPIVAFNNIEVISVSEGRTRQFDLIISPTLNLRHLPFIFKAVNWIGYFATNKIQSNFGVSEFTYDFASGHYLWRGVQLLKALNQLVGEKFEKNFVEKTVGYPQIITAEPSYFNQLANSRYVVVGIFSKFPDRQWPLKNFAAVTRQLVVSNKADKVVLIGDSSEHNIAQAAQFTRELQLPETSIVNTVGNNSLAETAFIIKNNFLFIGVDSGPSHLAYLASARSLVIFITVKPAERIPLTQSARKIKAIFPTTHRPLYSGLDMVDVEEARKIQNTITVPQVLEAIKSLL